MTPRYRAMILGGELKPIAELSGAFLTPKTPFHLQFAYYESALVVEFIVNRFGLENLKAVLHDLHEGVGINEAIAKHTEPMPALEKEFAAFATDRAKQLAPGLAWERPVADKTNGAASLLSQLFPEKPMRGHAAEPTLSDEEMDGGRRRTDQFLGAQPHRAAAGFGKERAEAKEPLRQLIERFPNQTGTDSPYPALAAVSSRAPRDQ
jgi:hypothetical protein